MERTFYRFRRNFGRVGIYLFAVLIILIAIFPFYWLVTTSLKHEVDFLTRPPQFVPLRPTIENYVRIFTRDGILRNFTNTAIVAVSTAVLAILLGSLAAFALAKTYISRVIRSGLLIWVLIVRIFPPIVTALPYFMIITTLGLYDTLIALIITYVSYCLPFTIWLMLGFFQELPRDIEKAAIVDGCSLWQRFYRIMLPISLPGIAVTAIFSFIMGWNEFLYASVLTSRYARTVPVVVATFISDRHMDWGGMSATGSLLVIPIIIAALFTQRYLVRGLTFGAVKE
jgi:multiple sugar transport system permease protein